MGYCHLRNQYLCCPMVQWIVCWRSNQKVASSNPGKGKWNFYFKIIFEADLYISEYQENSIWKRNMDTISRLWTQFSCSYNLCNQHSKNSIIYRQKLASHLFFHFLFEIQKIEIVFTIRYKIRVQWIQFLSIKLNFGGEIFSCSYKK